MLLECNLWMALESQRTKGTAEEDIRLRSNFPSSAGFSKTNLTKLFLNKESSLGALYRHKSSKQQITTLPFHCLYQGEYPRLHQEWQDCLSSKNWSLFFCLSCGGDHSCGGICFTIFYYHPPIGLGPLALSPLPPPPLWHQEALCR